MAPATDKVPPLHLPSGRTLQVALHTPPSTTDHAPSAVSPATDRAPSAAPLRIAAGSRALLDALDRGLLSLSSAEGEVVSVDTLFVEDFQVLRAFLTARGFIDEEEQRRPCSNCGEPLAVRPCAAMEWSPFLDDLDDPELDAPFPFDEVIPLPVGADLVPRDVPLAPGVPDEAGVDEAGVDEAGVDEAGVDEAGVDDEAVGSGDDVIELRLRPTTVAEARPVLEAPERLRPTAAQVRALGIVRLGEETHPGRIARALQRCDDATWDALLDPLDASWYPPRLEAWVRCEGCGARAIFAAPAAREFFSGEPRAGEAGGEPFPEFEAFSARVEAQARRIFQKLGARGVGLYVEGGPADCDEGGVALLGAYEPGEPEGHGIVARPPEVKIYYRTFRAMYLEDGPYDIDDELRETLEHELEHHRAFLEGHDPMDEEERAEIARELGGRLGSTEVLRRTVTSTRQAASEFLRRTWPLWAIALAVALLEAWSTGR